MTKGIKVCNNHCVSAQKAKVEITTADLVTFKDAAKELGVNPSSIYRMRDRGLFVPFKLGKTEFITRADLNKLKKERK